MTASDLEATPFRFNSRGGLTDDFRFSGRYLVAGFRTAADLGRRVPEPLRVADPHAGILKVYQLKRRPERLTALAPRWSQFMQACVAVVAMPAGGEPRHFNLAMWEDTGWAVDANREAQGWPKDRAAIELTWTFPRDGAYDADPGSRAWFADVVRSGTTVVSVRAELGERPEGFHDPGYAGFYTVRGDGEVVAIDTVERWFGPPTYGSARLAFGGDLTELGEMQADGCILQDLGWLLRGQPDD